MTQVTPGGESPKFGSLASEEHEICTAGTPLTKQVNMRLVERGGAMWRSRYDANSDIFDSVAIK